METGSIKGLKARGGFEIDIEWNDSEVNYAKNHSNNGRIIPIHFYNELEGEGLKAAEGDCPNPLFAFANIFLLLWKINLQLKLKKFMNMFMTQKNGDYALLKKD